MRQTDQLRKIVICDFAGIRLDMDYMLCIPSVHATYEQKEMIATMGVASLPR